MEEVLPKRTLKQVQGPFVAYETENLKLSVDSKVNHISVLDNVLFSLES